MSNIQKKPKKGAASWIVSFCDLMQLLLTFFIMLFATSSTDSAKLEELLSSFSRGSTILDKPDTENIIELNKKPLGSAQDPGDIVDGEFDKAFEKLEELKEQFEEQVSEYNSKEAQIIENELKDKLNDIGYTNSQVDELIEVAGTNEGVLVSFKDGALFEPGATKVKNGEILEILGNSFDNTTVIKIEGHTDNVPTTGSNFKSNWELSTARAISVMEFLTDNKFISEERCSVAGFGEFKPIAENTTAESRALNRRVEILLVNP